MKYFVIFVASAAVALVPLVTALHAYPIGATFDVFTETREKELPPGPNQCLNPWIPEIETTDNPLYYSKPCYEDLDLPPAPLPPTVVTDKAEFKVVGPEYTPDEGVLPCKGCKKGQLFNLFMPIADTFYNCDPAKFPSLKKVCQPNCGQEYGPPGTRNITVYVPAAYKDGDEAAVMIEPEGTDLTTQPQPDIPFPDGSGRVVVLKDFVSNLMDNYIGAKDETRSLPPFIYIAVGLAGPGGVSALAGGACGDGPGTARAIETVTTSNDYANFIAHELLPWIVNHADIKAVYPNFKITDDPSGRVVQGQSNGAANVFKMVWFTPDLFGTVIGRSPGLIKSPYNVTSDDVHPLGIADLWVPPPMGQDLIATQPLGKSRFWMTVSDNDLGAKGACIVGQPAAQPSNGWSFIDANNRTFAALAKKGYETQLVYGLNACHTDIFLLLQEMIFALEWAFSPWKKKLAEEIGILNSTNVLSN